jgi:hypothetical protein
MQYEEQNKARDKSRKYVEQSYSLPYKESTAKDEIEEGETDPYMRILLRQVRKLTVYSTSVTEYRVKLRRENR